MSNKKYSAIVFDLGNVLIPFDYNLFINRLNNIKPDLGKDFMDFYVKNYHIHRSFEKGNIERKDFIAKMLEVCGNRIDELTFCKYFSEIFSINEDTVSLLPVLKKNYKLFLLSNTNSIHKEFGYGHYDFLKYFDKLFLSHEVGAIKPEVEFYKAVENYSGIPGNELIFIDDIENYAQGAKNLGWDAITFQSYSQLIEQFDERGIIYK